MDLKSCFTVIVLIATFTSSVVTVTAQTPGRYALNLTDVLDNNIPLLQEVIAQKGLDPLTVKQLEIPRIALTKIKLKNFVFNNLSKFQRNGNVSMTFNGENIILTVPLSCKDLQAYSFYDASIYFTSTSGELGLKVKEAKIILMFFYNVPSFSFSSDVKIDMSFIQPDFGPMAGFWQRLVASVATVTFHNTIQNSIESFLHETIENQLLAPLNTIMSEKSDDLLNDAINSAMLYIKSILITSSQ